MSTNNYRNTLIVLGNTYKNAKSDMEKLEARQLYIIFLKKLIKSEQNNIEYYEDMIKNDGFDSESVEVILNSITNEIKIEETINDIEKIDFILSDDKDFLTQNEKLIKKLIEDFKNPNDLSIETWLSNYYSFVEMNKNKIDLEKMIIYLNKLFKRHDKDSKYSYLLNTFIYNVSKLQKKDELNDLNIVNIKRNYNDMYKKEINETAMTKLLKEKGIYYKNGKLLDKNGIPYNVDTLQKTMYDYEKINLIKCKTQEQLQNEIIDIYYKGNRYMQMLTNSNVVPKIKNNFRSINIEEDYTDSLVKKGLGNVK